MPVECCLTSYFSTELGARASVADPCIIPWWIYAPPKAAGLARALARDHVAGRVRLEAVEGSNHAELVEYFDLIAQVAYRLPNKNSTPEFELGAPLLQRAISIEEASAVAESVRVAARPSTPDIWQLPSADWGRRIIILRYLGGTLSAAKAQPKFSAVYPCFKALLQQGLPPIEATQQAYLDLQEAKRVSQDPTGWSTWGTTAANPVSTAAVEPKQEPEPSARALPSAPVTVPRRPTAPRAVLTPVGVPVGKAALPARPFRPPEPSASVGSPAAAGAHPLDIVKTPEGSDAEISPSPESPPQGVWRTEDRSRSPVGRVVNPTGSVAGYLPARPVGPPPQQVRPLARTPQQAREFPHSFIRIARAPANHRR